MILHETHVKHAQPADLQPFRDDTINHPVHHDMQLFWLQSLAPVPLMSEATAQGQAIWGQGQAGYDGHPLYHALFDGLVHTHVQGSSCFRDMARGKRSLPRTTMHGRAAGWSESA